MKRILIVDILLILLLDILYIYTVNSYVPNEYDRLEDELHRLQRENILLHEQLLRSKSYVVIWEEAKGMGFVNATYMVLYKDHIEIVK
jgi:hypothetical protein